MIIRFSHQSWQANKVQTIENSSHLQAERLKWKYGGLTSLRIIIKIFFSGAGTIFKINLRYY